MSETERTEKTKTETTEEGNTTTETEAGEKRRRLTPIYLNYIFSVAD